MKKKQSTAKQLKVTEQAARKIAKLIKPPRNKGKKNGVEGIAQPSSETITIIAPSSSGSQTQTTKELSAIEFDTAFYWNGDKVQTSGGSGGGELKYEVNAQGYLRLWVE